MVDAILRLATFPVQNLWRLGALLGLAMGMTVAAGVLAPQVGSLDPAIYLESAGYLGLFVITLVSSATVGIPVPGLLAVVAAGKLLDPLVVGLVAGAGMTIGELSGYLIGTAGRAAATSGSGLLARLLKSVEGIAARHGLPVIFVLALVPNPAFDLAGVAAGASGMRLPTFVAATFAGKTLRCLAIALAAATWLPALRTFW